MGAPQAPTPLAAPRAVDTKKAELNALAYAEVQRRIRQSQGRGGQFITKSVGGRQRPKGLLGE